MMLFCDGAKHIGSGLGTDLYLAKKWTGVLGATVSTLGPNGGNCIQLGLVRKTLINLAGSGTSWANMWKLWVSQDGGNGAGFTLSSVSKEHVLKAIFSLILEPDNIFSIYGGGLLLNRIDALPIHVNTWYTIEVNIFTFQNTLLDVWDGTWNIRINKELVSKGRLLTDVSATDVNNRPTSFQFNGNGLGVSRIAFPFIYDDVGGSGYTMSSVLDSLLPGVGNPIFWAGDARIITVFPNADTGTKTWSSTGVNNFDQINETGPPDTTNYVSSITPGNVDLYGWQPVPSNLEILSIQQSIYARKSDAGSRAIKHQAGSDDLSLFHNVDYLSDDYVYLHEPADHDPATGLQWTPASFNAKQFGQILAV